MFESVRRTNLRLRLAPVIDWLFAALFLLLSFNGPLCMRRGLEAVFGQRSANEAIRALQDDSQDSMKREEFFRRFLSKISAGWLCDGKDRTVCRWAIRETDEPRSAQRLSEIVLRSYTARLGGYAG